MEKEIIELRKAIWDAYKKEEESEFGIEGKSSEGYVEIYFPNYFECDSFEEFCQPTGVMVYSYALGPSRRHFFWKSKKESTGDYNEWYSRNIFKKAVSIVKSWTVKEK